MNGWIGWDGWDGVGGSAVNWGGREYRSDGGGEQRVVRLGGMVD